MTLVCVKLTHKIGQYISSPSMVWHCPVISSTYALGHTHSYSGKHMAYWPYIGHPGDVLEWEHMAKLVCHHQILGSQSHSKLTGITCDNCDDLTDRAFFFTCVSNWNLMGDYGRVARGDSFSNSLRAQKALAATNWLAVGETQVSQSPGCPDSYLDEFSVVSHCFSAPQPLKGDLKKCTFCWEAEV
jgi:hypothetical protein